MYLTKDYFLEFTKNSQNSTGRDFPGGAVVKSLPVNAGDMGLNPGPERSHMLRSN